MFSKASKGSNKVDGRPVAPSIVSSDLRVIGDLRSAGEIHIDGAVEGDIETSVLLVGVGASVKGQITADSVRVLGSVNGEIKAKSVHIAKTARINGDIIHEDLAIESGAFVDGHYRRMDSAKTATGASLNLVKSESGGDADAPKVAGA